MGDEDRSQELPQRAPGTTRGGSDRSNRSPVLSEELRQRLQAAVKAERAQASDQDHQTSAGPAARAASAAANGDTAGPAVNGFPGPRTQVAEPGRTGEPAATAKLESASGPIRRPAQDPVDRAAVPKRSERRLPRVRLLTLIVILAVAGSLVTAASLLTANSSGGHVAAGTAALQRQEAVTSQQAARWVARQVDPADVVSCDRVMCAALRAAGFPGAKLLVLGPTSQPPVTSAVVVVTAAVRSLFGSSLGSAWAPAVLASFGSGGAQITIRVMSAHGAGAYRAAFTADQAGRSQTDSVLLNYASRIKMSALDEEQLTAGLVDVRLAEAINWLAATTETIDIVEFGNTGPGASGDVLLDFADLAESGQAAQLSSSAYVRILQGRLITANAEYHPLSSQTVTLPGGQKVFRVEFAAPSPLGQVSS